MVDTLVGEDPHRNRMQQTDYRMARSEAAPAEPASGKGRLGWRLLCWLGLSRRPETVDEAMARLAATSPHLLDDIGVHLSSAPMQGARKAGRGPVATVTVLEKPAPRPADPAVRPTASVPLAAE